MSNINISFGKIISTILLGGLVLFVAVFLGIQAGFALKGGGGSTSEITPLNLLNDTPLDLGEVLPPMRVKDLSGNLTSTADIAKGQKTVFVLAMPDCNPCGNLMKIWERNGVVSDPDGVQIIFLVSGAIDDTYLGKLAEYTEVYPMYFCDIDELGKKWGIGSFPNAVGVGQDNSISFVASAMVKRLDNEFFARYL